MDQQTLFYRTLPAEDGVPKRQDTNAISQFIEFTLFDKKVKLPKTTERFMVSLSEKTFKKAPHVCNQGSEDLYLRSY